MPRRVTNRLAGLMSRCTTPCAWAASSASAICAPSSSTSSSGSGAARDAILQRLAIEQLHHHELLAVVGADVVERADVRVIEVRDDPRFALEALDRVGVGVRFVGQELDRDLPAEPRVFRFVDDAHAAGAEARQDLVVRNGLADHSDPVSGSSSTSRIFFASCIGVNGFCRNGLPSSSTPVLTIASSV